MSESAPMDGSERPPLRVTQQIDALCDEFESSLGKKALPSFSLFVHRVDSIYRSQLLQELVSLAVEHLQFEGHADPTAHLLQANADLAEELKPLLADNTATAVHAQSDTRTVVGVGLHVRCPHCHGTIEMIVDTSLIDIACPNCGSNFGLVNDAERTRDATALTRVAHFELVERLGMGEFGTVWKARDTILDRTVALKIPRRKQLDAVSVEKFMREARAAAHLRHPNIISTHEVGRHEDTLYIVIDYIRGVSLGDMLADHRLGVSDSVAIASKVSDALEHAHRGGVVHRDLKPSNILVDDDGEPHLMDFGLAKRKETEVTVTTDGAILGTPAYMSPEQARGEASHVDGRSDIYSLGVIIFQLLTGELPFRGSLRMLLQKVINDDPPGPHTLDSRVPKDLDTICLKCMEKDPGRRYATAGELAADLRRFTMGEPIAARRIGAAARTFRWARRNRAISLSLAATMFTLTAATMCSSYFAWHAAQNAVRADQQAIAVTDTLYDSLLQEIRLTREVRQQGYGEKVCQLVDQAQHLPTTRVDDNELRRQLSLTMGDFVAYPPVVIRPSGGEASSIRLSSDGREIIVGLSNGRLQVYDVETGQLTAELEAFASVVQSIALTTDDNRLTVADQAGEVRMWRRLADQWRAEPPIHIANKPSPHSVFLSAEGELVAYVNGALLEVWEVAAASKLREFPTEPDWMMRNAAFDLANRRLFSGFKNGKADTVGWTLWDLDTAERLHLVTMPSLGNTYSNGIDLDQNGDRLAIGFDEALLVYEMADFQRTSFFGFDATKAVSFSPTSPYLAAVNIRGWVSVWNSVTNRHLATLEHPRPGASRDDLAFSADGTHLAASNFDSIHVWNLARANEKTVMTGHEGGIPSVAFHPNGRLLASGGKDDQVQFWNPLTGQLVDSIGLDQAAQALKFTEDGRLLAVGCMGGTGAPHLKLIDMQTREIVHEEHPVIGRVHSLAWADRADGRYLAACGPAGVALRKVSRDSPFTMEETLKLDRNWCLATTISREGSLLVWAQDDWHLQAWDVDAARQKPLRAPPMLQGWHGVAFLPDGESIIYVSKAGVAEVWNVEEDRRVDRLGEPGTFNAPHIALSPNGEWFAVLTQPDTVSIWHRPTGAHVYSLRPEVGTVWSLAWDASSTQLAVGQSDGGLGVWHLPRIQRKLAASGLPWTDSP